MIVAFTTSFLVGHATLRSSPFTSPRYSLGPIFSRLGAAEGGRRLPPSDAGALGLSVPCFAIMRLVCRFIATAAPSSARGQVVVRCRAGGTRTPNRRFWRPVLYQLSYCPPYAVGPDHDTRASGAGPRRLDGSCVRRLAAYGDLVDAGGRMKRFSVVLVVLGLLLVGA